MSDHSNIADKLAKLSRAANVEPSAPYPGSKEAQYRGVATERSDGYR